MESKEEKIQPLNPGTYPTPRSYPWLLFDGGQRQIFFDVSTLRWYKEDIPELAFKYMHDCSHGWYLLIDPGFTDCCLFNPTSREKIELPQPENNQYDLCFLSSPPSDPACHIVLINLMANFFEICKLGDDEFTQVWIKDEDDSKIVGAALVGETIYCLTRQQRLVDSGFTGLYLSTALLTSLEAGFTYIITEQKSLQELPLKVLPYLIAGCDQIFLLLKLFRSDPDFGSHSELRIYVMDSSKKQWVKLKSLGDRTIFLTEKRGMICLAANIGVKADAIYLTVANDRHLYVYDYRQQILTTTLPCPIVGTYWESFWMMLGPN